MEFFINTINGTEHDFEQDSPHAALNDFYQGFNGRNIAMVSKSWNHNDCVSMSNPLGGIKRGWEEVQHVYETIFLGETEVFVEFYDIHIRTGNDFFIAVGRERGFARRNGKTLELAIRTSRFFVRDDGAWKQYHHHGSMDDPQNLDAYQKMIRGI